MMRVKMSDGDITFVLEPANIRLMKEGKAVTVDLAELGLKGILRIYFTPDLPRLQAEIKVQSRDTRALSGDDLEKIVAGSLEWRELDRLAN